MGHSPLTDPEFLAEKTKIEKQLMAEMFQLTKYWDKKYGSPAPKPPEKPKPKYADWFERLP